MASDLIQEGAKISGDPGWAVHQLLPDRLLQLSPTETGEGSNPNSGTLQCTASADGICSLVSVDWPPSYQEIFRVVVVIVEMATWVIVSLKENLPKRKLIHQKS